MTIRYNGLKREMASSKQALGILFEYGKSKPRVWQEYGWSMARVCLERLFFRQERTFGPSGTNSFSVGNGLRFLRYAVCVILMMVVGIGEMWGQIDEGFYYIASNQAKADNIENSSPYSSTDPSGNFYLCPAIGSYYDNNVDLPHLTTFKTNQDQNSLWKIEAVEDETNCYYLIHYKTGKYLASNATPNYNIDGNKNRKVVHLEKKADDDDSDIYKFYIINHDGNYQIYPADYRPGGTLTDASSMSLNVKGDNWSMYVPYNGLATGIIGVYDYVTKGKANPGSQWKLEPLTSSQPCATPVIKYSGDQINISYPYTSETGITIYYTTDGTDPSTSSSSNASTSFNISTSGVVKVRAFATKSGCANSDEAVLWGSARPFLIQSKEDANYYLVPAGDGTNVNTTSIAGEPMQWTLQNAGASTNGVPYYYLVNSNGKKINYNTSDNTLTLNEESVDANKFCIIEDGNTSEFFIIPISGASTDNDKSCRAVYKNDGNVKNTNSKAELIKGDSQDNINRVHWLLRICNDGTDQKILFANPPFSVSTDEEIHYYKIANVGSSGYYIIPPVDPAGYATTSNTSSDYTDKPWIFKVAASDNWLTYYYIINAETGKYMYFNIADGQTGTKSNVISMKDVSEKNASNENRFQFVMVRSTTTDACYIVPKGYANNFRNSQYYGISVNGTDPLQSIWSRSADVNGVKWTFESTTYANVWADPEITCDIDGHITITNGEEADGAEFYYTINTGMIPPATPTTTESETNFKYDSSNKPTVSVGFTTIKVRAIASGKGFSNVVTKTIVYNPTIEFTAGDYTYTGSAQNPSITSVTVGETSIDPSEYEVRYKKGDDDTQLTGCVEAGIYKILLIDAADGDYIVCGSSSTTFTITPKALTITADGATKVYDGTALTKNTYTNTTLATGDAIESVTFTGSQTVVGTSNNVPSAAVIKNSSDVNVTASYDITYTNGTLEVTQKALTITADSDTKEYDGTALTKGTYTSTALAAGDVITSVTVTGSQTDKGDSDNVPSAAVIKNNNGNGDDVTACYDITYVNGTLSVTGRVITITAGSDTKVYDGTALTNNSYTYDDTKLYSGDVITSVTVTGSQTVVGSSANEPSDAVIMNGQTDVTENYAPTYVNGILEVTQKTLTIKADDDTKVYDGTALTKSTFTNTALATGDAIESVTVTGNQTVVGSSANVPSAAVIKNSSNETVTASYNITYTNGTLEVTRASVTVTADDASKIYGESDPASFTATVTGMVNNESESLITINSISRAEGEDAGNYTITPAGDVTQGNYAVSYVTGTFTITPKSMGDGNIPAVGITIVLNSSGELTEVKDGVKILTCDTDYTYTTATDGSDKVVTVTGKGNYKDSAKGLYANPVFIDPDGNGSEMAAAVYEAKRDMANPSNITPYIVRKVNPTIGTLTISPLGYIPEGVPVLLLSDTEAEGFTASPKDDSTPEITDEVRSSNKLMVSDGGVVVEDTQAYLFYRGEFVLTKAGTISSGRFFLYNPNYKATPSPAPSPSPARYLRLVIEEEEDPDGMDNGQWTTDDGQLDDAWYTIDGRKLNGKPTQKGMYINGGKKVIITSQQGNR